MTPDDIENEYYCYGQLVALPGNGLDGVSDEDRANPEFLRGYHDRSWRERPTTPSDLDDEAFCYGAILAGQGIGLYELTKDWGSVLRSPAAVRGYISQWGKKEISEAAMRGYRNSGGGQGKAAAVRIDVDESCPF